MENDSGTATSNAIESDVGRTTRNTLENLVPDVRLAARGLVRAPGFTAMAVATIALGLGANAAIFSVVNGVLLRPLPYADSDELTRVWGRFLPESGFDFPYFPVDPTEYVDVRDDGRAFESVAAYASRGVALSGADGMAERRGGLVTTWNLFSLLGVEASLGRTFVPDDDIEGGPDVAVVSHTLWETRFGADPGIVGSTVTLNRETFEVVGVLPPGFSFPGPGVDVYMPLQLGENPSNRRAHYLNVVGRRADGVSLENAEADIRRLMAGWAVEYPDIHTGHFLFLEGFKDAMVRGVRPALLLLLGAVGFVLLVACANVANLLMVRGHARAGEVAVRRALGASRGRVLQLFLVESTLLAAVGALFGLAIAGVGVPLLLEIEAGAVPLAHEISIDGSVLAFTALLAALTVLAFGLAPAAQALGEGAAGTLREDARAGSSTRGRVRVRNLLIAAEVALSFVLVIGAGLMIRSVGNLLAEDPGFDTERSLVANFSLPAAAYPRPGDGARFLDEVVEAAEAVPGVTAVTHVAHLPMRGQSVIDFQLEGMPEPGPGQPSWNAGFTAVRANYFETMGIDVVQGRAFDPSVDRADGEIAVVVSRSLADRFLAGRAPLGQRMRFGGLSELPWWTIVGVVEDVQYQALGDEGSPMYYLPTAQLAPAGGGDGLDGYERFGTLVVRTGLDRPLAIAEPLRRAVAEIDAEVPLTDLATLESVVAESVASSRFVMTLLGLFAGLALALGAIGIYGVTSFVVSQRVHEIGIHKALGAGAGEVMALVVRQGLAPIGVGVAVGIVGAVASGRLLSSLLYGVEPSDAVTYAAVLGVLGLVALSALWLPARRAARLDPMTSLRNG
jgi:putative ABC transport system permease protein